MRCQTMVKGEAIHGYFTDEQSYQILWNGAVYGESH